MRKLLPILIIVCYFFSTIQGELGQIGHSLTHIIEAGGARIVLNLTQTQTPSDEHSHSHSHHHHHSHSQKRQKNKKQKYTKQAKHSHSNFLLSLLSIDPLKGHQEAPEREHSNKKVDKHQGETDMELHLPSVKWVYFLPDNEGLQPSPCLPFPTPPPEFS